MKCGHNPLRCCITRAALLLQATHSPARDAIHASQHVLHGIGMPGHAAVHHMATCSAYAHWGLPTHGKPSPMTCNASAQAQHTTASGRDSHAQRQTDAPVDSPIDDSGNCLPPGPPHDPSTGCIEPPCQL